MECGLANVDAILTKAEMNRKNIVAIRFFTLRSLPLKCSVRMKPNATFCYMPSLKEPFNLVFEHILAIQIWMNMIHLPKPDQGI
jgi:hypothetical protein